MSRPLIGLTPTFQDGRPYVPQTYCAAIERAGGEWRLLSFAQSEEEFCALSGVLFTGGVDVDPAVYGQKRQPACGEIQPVRDRCELRLLSLAIRQDMPVLGICRGIQLINVGLGGTLRQHLPQTVSTPHQGTEHPLELLAGGWLRGLSDQAIVPVNSFHHQAISRLAPGLRACAVGPEGVIEAVERPGARFFKAVQWHPERYAHPLSDAIFAAFVESAGRR